jgi:hypothetical protein
MEARRIVSVVVGEQYQRIGPGFLGRGDAAPTRQKDYS